jgi:hypothetical protein
MTVKVPEEGLRFRCDGLDRVREARAGDVDAMEELEWEMAGIRRKDDYLYFLENRRAIWHTSVIENRSGGIDGFIVSVNHPASNMLGPGVMRTEADAAALVLGELNHHRGRSPVWLAPAACGNLVRQLYAWGARNCEIHLFQARGHAEAFRGVVMPTFMPETG